MSERVPCEFFLIRYVPDLVKGEFANIGVLLREVSADADPPSAARKDGAPTPRAHVRFTRDWSRVRCLDADADLGLLEALESEIAERLKAGAAHPAQAELGRGTRSIVELIEDTFSNSIQMTEARACLAENAAAELDLLMKLYVEPLKVKQERRRTGRAAIAATMRGEFERAGVWGLMRKRIAASIYTLPGDPLKIDCGYRPNGVIRMFHAVSLEAEVEAAKVLAYTAPRLHEGVQRVEGARLELTAVVEPLRAAIGNSGGAGADDDAGERYRFGVAAMESQQIRVITTADLARAAETARVELRV